jgi:hypothetical protein
MPQFIPKTVSTTVDLATDILLYSIGDEKTDSFVIDPATVTANSDGRKIVPAGAFITKITATKAYGPHAAGAADGRQTIARGSCAVTTAQVDVTDGPVAIGGYIGDAIFKTAKLTLYGATLGAVQAALPTCEFR